jgi:hypothetical protein
MVGLGPSGGTYCGRFPIKKVHKFLKTSYKNKSKKTPHFVPGIIIRLVVKI